MKFGAEEIEEQAAALGFRPDTMEKVFRLLSLLETLRSNAFLRPRVALKGGTALNLFLFEVPRLSMDIDLNYVGAGDRATMLADKPKVEQSIQMVCAREGLRVKRMPSEHAGGKWLLSFVNTAGSPDQLEVDLNFMLRVPLWPVTMQDSRALGLAVAKEIAVVDRHELAAGKLASLCSRNASRDLFDARELLRRTDIDRSKLRLAFVIYGGMNRRDWRTVQIDNVGADALELKRDLVPMLRADVRPKDAEIPSWADALVRETRELMKAVLPLIIWDHPGLKWKVLNVKKRLGVAVGAGDVEPA